METQVINSAYINREAFDQLETIMQEGAFSDVGQILYDKARQFYLTDPDAKAVDIEFVKNQLQREYPRHCNSLIAVINNFKELSAPNIIKEYKDMQREQIALRLAGALTENNQPEIEKLLDQYQKLYTHETKTEDLVYINENVTSVVDRTSGDNLIPIYPEDLNNALDGGVVAGSHILVYARPDGGKTVFGINNACNWAHAGNKVLYIGNEDPADQMLTRFISRMSGMNRHEIKANPDLAQDKISKHGYENLIFAPLSPGTPKQIRGLIEIYEPNMVVIDQLRNLNVGNFTKVEQLEEAAKFGRSIGKEYGVTVLSVTQAGDSAQNKLVLDMGDVDFSNTGIPAQMDLMIGLGTDEHFRNTSQVMLSISKNKINGNYNYFPVKLDKTISRMYT